SSPDLPWRRVSLHFWRCKSPTSIENWREVFFRLQCRVFAIGGLQKSSPIDSFTVSPAAKGGRPAYGQPLQRNASPRAQLPQLLLTPSTVKSISRLMISFFLGNSMGVPLASASAFSSSSLRPQLQFLQAFLILDFSPVAPVRSALMLDGY